MLRRCAAHMRATSCRPSRRPGGKRCSAIALSSVCPRPKPSSCCGRGAATAASRLKSGSSGSRMETLLHNAVAHPETGRIWSTDLGMLREIVHQKLGGSTMAESIPMVRIVPPDSIAKRVAPHVGKHGLVDFIDGVLAQQRLKPLEMP